MNDLAGFGLLAERPMNILERLLRARTLTPTTKKSRSPYSSTKLGFVNNPG
jgi:hypothetical protein